MPKRFEVTDGDAKKFIKWVHKFAFDDSKRYANLRSHLREESSVGKNRKKSQTFLKEMHKQFKSMEGCNTDVTASSARRVVRLVKELRSKRVCLIGPDAFL